MNQINRVRIETDRRHDRRSLSEDEFARILIASATGQSVEGVAGPDRAMLYILATWTGLRRRELSSLTRNSFDLHCETPAVTVVAGYSKHRRKDQVPLHPWVVERLLEWLDERGPAKSDEPIFKLRTPKGYFRKTSKMMKHDLAQARKVWIEEAETDEVIKQRKEADFLTYQNSSGDFADFHANRHTFISRLGRQGVSLGIAQKLARHSDPPSDL